MIKKRNQKQIILRIVKISQKNFFVLKHFLLSLLLNPKSLPLAIQNKNIITQGIATIIVLNEKKSNCMLHNKHCTLKRGTYKGLEVPHVINDVYINEHDDGYFFDITNSNDIRKIKSIKEIRVTFDSWNL